MQTRPECLFRDVTDQGFPPVNQQLFGFTEAGGISRCQDDDAGIIVVVLHVSTGYGWGHFFD